LVACNIVTTEITVASITVEESSLEDIYDIESFDLSSIEIKVIFTDGKFEIIPVTSAMLSQENLAKLAEIGTHQITVTYEGKTTTFTLNLGYGTFKTQLMAIYELAVTANAFSGTYEEWLESVRGPEGKDGVDGKTVALRVAEGFIQWQYQGDATWSNLISLELLAGKDGNDGENGKEVVFQAANG